MRRDAEIKAITDYLMGAGQYGTEEEGLAEVQRLVGADLRLAREARRDLDRQSMWPRVREEGLLRHLREDYRYDRAMRILDAVIKDEPLTAPPTELQAVFEADRRADELIDEVDELVHQGDIADEDILREVTREDLSDGTKQRLVIRSGKESAILSNQWRTVRLLLQLAGEPSEGDGDENQPIPGMDEFYALSDEEAFQRIAVEVPQLLALREATGPEPLPLSLSHDQARREFRRKWRELRKDPDWPRELEWRRSVWKAMTELKRLVGPDASHDSELVRSEIALFKCANVLLPIRLEPPTDDDRDEPR